MRGTVGVPVAQERARMAGRYAFFGRGVNTHYRTFPTYTQFASSATPHAAGSWVEVVATTTTDLNGLILLPAQSSSSGATDSSALMDIGVGAAGAEVAVVTNIDIGWTQTALLSDCAMPVPVFIPRGSRIAFRQRGVRTSNNQRIAVTRSIACAAGDARNPSKLDSIGALTASSSGTAITAPTVNNTKGAWTELVAATAQPYKGIIPIIGLAAGTTSVVGTAGYLDVAVGAAGSEVVIATDIPFGVSGSEYVYGPAKGGFVILHHVPAGTRLSVRAEVADKTSFAVSASMIGVPFS